jgi:hypothetical protein
VVNTAGGTGVVTTYDYEDYEYNTRNHMCSREHLAATRSGCQWHSGEAHHCGEGVSIGESIVLLVAQVRTLPISCAVASESASASSTINHIVPRN